MMTTAARVAGTVFGATFGLAWYEDPGHVVAALLAGMASGAVVGFLVAAYVEWVFRRLGKGLNDKVEELRSFDQALSIMAGRVNALSGELASLREEMARRRDPGPWDLGPGPRR